MLFQVLIDSSLEIIRREAAGRRGTASLSFSLWILLWNNHVDDGSINQSHISTEVTGLRPSIGTGSQVRDAKARSVFAGTQEAAACLSS